jgi:hypothetical protein
MSYEPVKIDIPKKEKLRIWAWVKKHNTANRGKFDGNLEKQFLGKLAESMVCEYMTGKELELKDDGFDGGVDFVFEGIKVDVKSMGRNVFTKEHYENNFIDDQKEYKTDMLVFTSINKKKQVLEICGWLSKEEFLEVAEFHKQGQKIYRDDGSSFENETGLWTCKNSQLKDIRMLI